MKTTKLVVGIVSLALSVIVLFQSCAASVGDALEQQGGTSGAAGVIVAILMIVAGIVAIAARKSKGGSIFCLIAYAIAGIVGLTSCGIYKDLIVWSVVCLVFAVLFLLDVILSGKKAKDERSVQ